MRRPSGAAGGAAGGDRAWTCCAARPAWLGLALAALLGSPAAHGAPEPSDTSSAAPSEPSAADKETARGLVALGDEKFEAGDYAAALRAYQGADAIMGVPTTGIEVGRAQVALGLLVEARDTLLRVSRFPQSPGEPEPFARAREQATELADGLARRIPSLQIDVAGLSADVAREVRVDGDVVEQATLGLPRKMNPGKHVVAVTAPGFVPIEIALDLAEGEARVLDARMRSDTAPPEPSAGSVSPLVYIGFGVAGGGVLLGSIFGGASLALAADVKDQCTNDVCPGAAEADADRSVTLAHVSTVSFIVAIAGAAVGVVGLLLPAAVDDEPATAAVVEPLVGPGFVGLQGRF